jgi:hypothetical protein
VALAALLKLRAFFKMTFGVNNFITKGTLLQIQLLTGTQKITTQKTPN